MKQTVLLLQINSLYCTLVQSRYIPGCISARTLAFIQSPEAEWRQMLLPKCTQNIDLTTIYNTDNLFTIKEVSEYITFGRINASKLHNPSLVIFSSPLKKLSNMDYRV